MDFRTWVINNDFLIRLTNNWFLWSSFDFWSDLDLRCIGWLGLVRNFLHRLINLI